MSSNFSNPASASFAASSGVFATLVMYSSPSIVCRSTMYLLSALASLCPSKALTYLSSLVLWYSIVALKRLKSYSDMFLYSGSC